MEAKLYYNSIAKGYANLYHEEQKKKIILVKDKFIQKGKVLDLAAGDGVLNEFISKEVELYSFDLSKELLKLNSNKKENKFCGDSSKLPFKDNYFDAIYSFTAMQDIIKLEDTFNEIKRVLKKDGQLIISFLKISKKKDIIINLIQTFCKKDTEREQSSSDCKNFEILEQLEEEKDLIFILRNEA